MIIVIDGPAGTGKTTIAKMIAEKIGFHYFDTGALYRSLTVVLMEKGVDVKDSTRVHSVLQDFHFDAKEGRYFANGEDVTEKIRTPEVTGHVSAVAALPIVREMLIHVQRDFANERNAVFEGRDLGTVVFPSAHLKIFLTARPAVRAERRYLELKEKGIGTTEKEVLNQITERDHFDSTREIAPLKQAEDAHLIDTSDLTIEGVVKKIETLIPTKK
ncbi:MAG: (d)CMP kinase [Chlamydiales bacterium]|nr:(d)CMP kinase [Chlamydiales bacterium]